MADQGSARGAGSDGGEVELSLRLRTGSGGSSSPAAAATARRSMTIFYNGRVCAVDVTELQARAIITMANQEILTQQQQQRINRDSHQQDSSGSSTAAAARPEPPALQRHAAALPASLPRRQQGLEAAAGAVPVTMNQAAAPGLSMKRSLQRFLQKRKTRAAAVGSPYAGDRTAQPR